MTNLFSVYLGAESEKGFSGFIVENNFYCILEINDGFNQDDGRLVLRKIADTLKQSIIKGLHDFDSVVDKCIKENSLPLDCSLSVGYETGSVLYLKTVGEGEVLIRRGDQFATLIKENNIASGKIEENDLLIFSTNHFTKELNGVEELEPIFDHKKPKEIVETLTPKMKEKNDTGAICLFVQFIPESEEPFDDIKTNLPQALKTESARLPLSQSIPSFLVQHKKKIGIFVGTITIVLFFVLNGGKLFFPEKQQNARLSFDSVNQAVRSKIGEAENIAPSDLKGASLLLSESYTLVSEYKQKTKDNKTIELEQFLNDKKKELLRIKTVTPLEVTDLAIEEKGAKGDSFSLYGDTVAILNKAGSIYLFSLEKNTLKRFKKAEFVNADLIAQYESKTYIYKKLKGIYEIANDGKIKKVIEQDDEWGNLIAMQGYNANIYVVDAGTDDIYKYTGGETGFSGKISYLQSGKPDLTNAHSLAIDSALYIGLPNKVLKYLTGVIQDFNPVIPMDTDSVSISKVITNKDIDNIYLWEKEKGLIYVFNKEGSYQFQVQSSSLSKATDVVVYKNDVYSLMGNKIYSFSLE